MEEVLAPLPQAQILESLRSEEWDNLEHLLDLDARYQKLERQPGWQDLHKRLVQVKADLEDRILKGEKDQLGNDMTPYLRAAYGIVCQMITIPQSITKRRRTLEQQYMHYDSGESL
jgi:hypothetical protein